MIRTRFPRDRHKPRSPLDQEALERLALHYVGRYATTRSRLGAYLLRKIGERGWAGDGKPSIERVVEKMVTLGFVDDAVFAAGRVRSMHRRGYGERRITQALAAAGIADEDREEAGETMTNGALAAALRFAERRRLGPYAVEKPDRAARERSFAAMMRAGHPIEIVRKVLEAEPGHVPDQDGI
jgi:regulatory protein